METEPSLIELKIELIEGRKLKELAGAGGSKIELIEGN